jgi:hypothetical protein
VGAHADPLGDCSVERMRGQPVVLCIRDSTELNYSTQPGIAGLGPLNTVQQHGLPVHPTLAVTPDGVPLGVLDAWMWVRDQATFGEAAQFAQPCFVSERGRIGEQSLQQTGHETIARAGHLGRLDHEALRFAGEFRSEIDAASPITRSPTARPTKVRMTTVVLE